MQVFGYCGYKRDMECRWTPRTPKELEVRVIKTVELELNDFSRIL